MNKKKSKELVNTGGNGGTSNPDSRSNEESHVRNVFSTGQVAYNSWQERQQK